MDEIKIKNATESYWILSQNGEPDIYLKEYVCTKKDGLDKKSLLEAEVSLARENNGITAKQCNTLVLLVGFSLEPLLQSVFVHKPTKIVLLLNEEGYMGEEWQVFAKHLIKAIGHLSVDDFDGRKVQLLGEKSQVKTGYPTKGDPASVFKTLVNVLHNEDDVVIDITGGKKSMVTGAFMYAAYAGARISYVDFEEYNPEKRRPYGFGCKIGELTNPYEKFALHEWELVRTLYKRYQFRDARDLLLGPILGIMENILPETMKPIKCLGAFLDYYEKWDFGDFRGAKQASNTLVSFIQPSAVEELGDTWYEFSDRDFCNKPEGFYGNQIAVNVYVCDELERIRRLIEYKQDYRSAFLRASGVCEIIMISRIVRLVTNPTERDNLLDALNEVTPNASKVFKAMTYPEKSQIDVKKDIYFKNAPSIIISRPYPMTAWWKDTTMFNADNGWEIFLTKRNELAHKYFSVPREWAENALNFSQANFEDFSGQSIGAMNLQTSALNWSDLVQLCGLKNYLPPNLIKEM